jgi:hypothetical protein
MEGMMVQVFVGLRWMNWSDVVFNCGGGRRGVWGCGGAVELPGTDTRHPDDKEPGKDASKYWK